MLVEELGAKTLAGYGRAVRVRPGTGPRPRTGDPAEIAGYIGDADTFDRAVCRVRRRLRPDQPALLSARTREAIDAGEIAATPDV